MRRFRHAKSASARGREMDVAFKLASGGLIAISAIGTAVVLYGGYRYTVVRPQEMRALRAAAGAATPLPPAAKTAPPADATLR